MISLIRFGDFMNLSYLALMAEDLHKSFSPENEGTVFLNYWISWISLRSTSFKMEAYFRFFDKIVLKFVFNSVVSSFSPLMIYFLLYSELKGV